MFKVLWTMVAKIAGMDAMSSKGSVPGVVLMVGVAIEIGLEMDVLAFLEEGGIINVYCKVCQINLEVVICE